MYFKHINKQLHSALYIHIKNLVSKTNPAPKLQQLQKTCILMVSDFSGSCRFTHLLPFRVVNTVPAPK